MLQEKKFPGNAWNARSLQCRLRLKTEDEPVYSGGKSFSNLLEDNRATPTMFGPSHLLCQKPVSQNHTQTYSNLSMPVFFPLSFCRYTSRTTDAGTYVYAILLKWPSAQDLPLALGAPQPSEFTTVSLVGYTGYFTWKPLEPTGMEIDIPTIPASDMPCQWAWVLRFTELVNWCLIYTVFKDHRSSLSLCKYLTGYVLCDICLRSCTWFIIATRSSLGWWLCHFLCMDNSMRL